MSAKKAGAGVKITALTHVSSNDLKFYKEQV